MDYNWYFPDKNSGGGGQNFDTKRLEINSSMMSISTSIPNVSDKFSHTVEAYKIIDNIEYPTTVSEECIIADSVASFYFNWQTPFKGYLLINYWTQNE